MKARIALVTAALGACVDDVRPYRPGLAEYTGGRTSGIAMDAPVPPGDPGLLQPPLGQRLVHYSAQVTLKVTRVEETLDQVSAAAKAHGGRIESLGSDRIVARVPVAAFKAAWAEIRDLGERVGESVVAEEVSDSFSATDLRIETLTATRDRLMALMARSTDEAQRLALVHELQRVNEQIDVLDRRRRTLQGLADYSRIAVLALPREPVREVAAGPPVAGFDWIARLSPFDRTLGSPTPRLSLPVPIDMVAISPKGRFIAESAEGVALWTGWAPNDPAGDGPFWIDAVSTRLAGDAASATRSTRGRWACLTLVDAAPDSYTWEICAAGTRSDLELSVAEAFYPSPRAVRIYQPAIAAALTGGAS